MMAEKERGILEGADFPSLWDILQGVDGRTRYQHLITGVTTQTRPHQLAGGIIADEMGLGKTLSVLALIAWYLDSLPSKSTRSSTTLIITTLSTVPGWQQQISRHFRPGQIRTAVYQGSDRRKHLAQLFNNDIVVTTYDTLRQEWKSDAEQGALFSKNSTFFSSSGPWARVVLDEAHHIRNRSSKLFQAISDLRSQYRWCLTGTPIHNKLDDFGALLSFIGVPPFTGRSGKASFEEWVSAPVHSFTGHSKGLLRLRKLVAATCLRRTKIHVQDQLMLPACVERQQFVDLDAAERRLYDWFKQQASSLLAGKSQRLSLDTKGTKNILSSINLLRLICNHGERLLPNNALELWKTQNWSTFDLDFQPNDIESEECEDSLSDPISSLPRTPLTSPTLSDAEYWPSSKLKILLNNLQEEQRGNHSPCEDAPIKR
jgi:SNF2 family DNA or RNA helicase